MKKAANPCELTTFAHLYGVDNYTANLNPVVEKIALIEARINDLIKKLERRFNTFERGLNHA